MSPTETPSGEPFQPALKCWFCSERFRLDDVLDGILRARTESEGGPYRVAPCPQCHRHNMCEKTPRNRWFSSPDFRPNLLDYLVGTLFLKGPEDFLQAVSWYGDNEERRRYFFERDGDRRYSSSGILSKLWGLGREERAAGAKKGGERQTRGERASPPPPPAGAHRPLPSPWEILGVDRHASEKEIRRAFHRLAVEYHPDKVHHLGEEFQTVATRKFKELQKAYEALLRRRSG